MSTSKDILELVTINEVARQSFVDQMTARRRVVRRDIECDAVLLNSVSANPIPLFLKSRIPEISKLIKKNEI